MNNNNPLKNESLSDNSAHPEIVVIINCALNAALMIITITGNSLVLTAIYKTPALRSPSITLLCSLAVSDLLVGLVGQPLYIAKHLKEDILLRRISHCILYGCCGVSLFTLTAISLDRFAALHYHMRYVTMVTTTRVIYTLHPVWLLIFPAFGIYVWDKFVYYTGAAVFIIICLSISLYSYIRIFQIVKRHQMQIHAQQQAVQSSEAGYNLNVMQLKKTSMNTFVFYVFLILCYIPMFILMMLNGILQKNWTKESTFSATVVFLNSTINPILYCWRIGELRTAVVKTAKKICTHI